MKLSLVLVALAAGGLFFNGWVPGFSRAAGDDGRVVTYYASGQPRSSTTWTEGSRSGPAAEWYPDGTKASEGNYDGGLRQGRWTFWRRDGTPDAERSGLYADGKKIAQ